MKGIDVSENEIEANETTGQPVDPKMKALNETQNVVQSITASLQATTSLPHQLQT